jgi:hypothetical protein
MPPRRLSRYTFSTAYVDEDDAVVLTEPEPYRFRDLSDNRFHVVAEGDTLHGLAAAYFATLPRPAGLWWVIADFQPEPVLDPTLRLGIGSVVVIPSLRTVLEEVFSERRRGE